MKTKLILCIGFFYVINTIAQPEISWQKSLGGAGEDVGRSVQQTSDGGYIVAGYTGSLSGDVTENHGGRDVWVVKLDNLGNIQWEKSLGSTGDEEAHEIKQTSDGGYIIIGMSDSNGFFGDNLGNDDILIIKLDNSGNIIWGKKYGTTGTDRGHSIRQTSDGGYIASGFRANGGIWVAKLDSTGNFDGNWSNTTFGGAQAWSVEQTLDGGYIVTGHWGITPDVVVIKLNSTSNVEWQYTFGGSNADYGRSIQQTLDGGYILTGMTQSNDGDVTNNYGGQDFWVIKLNASGVMQWQKTYGGSQNDFGLEIQQTTDGGYIIAGQTSSNDNDVSGNPAQYVFDYWVIKLNSLGTLLWQNCLGGTSSDSGASIQQTTDNGYIVAGRSISNNIDVSGNHGGFDFWVVKLDAETLSVNQNEFDLNNLMVYPNPVSSILNISTELQIESVSLYDILGKQVFMINLELNIIDVSKLSKGMYLLIIKTNRGEVTKKIIIN